MSFKEHWHKLEHWGSQHPVLLGLGIFIIGAIILWMIIPSRQPQQGQAILAQPQGPSDAYYGYQASLAEQGNRLHIAELETKAATDIAGLELTGLQTQVAGAVTIADYQYSTTRHVAELQQGADLAAIAANAASQDLMSTLSAQVAAGGFQRDIAVTGINAAALTDAAQIAAQRDLGITAYNAQVANSNIQAQLQGLINTNATQLGIADIVAGRDVTLGQIAGNTYLAGKTLDILGTGVVLPHQTVTYSTGAGQSGGFNINPPAIENIPVRELYERAGDPTVQGQIARQYWGA